MRADLVDQIPSLKKKYLKHENYKEQTVADIFGNELVTKSLCLPVYNTKSVCYLNTSNGFQEIPLPAEAQFSPVYALSIDDYDKDNIPDILLGGNFYWSKPEVGIYDASIGLLLKGHGDGTFVSVAPETSGVCIRGEIRDIKNIPAKENLVLIVRNNDKPVMLKRNK